MPLCELRFEAWLGPGYSDPIFQSGGGLGSGSMNIELDSYVLRARLWPALLAGLPAVFATLVWFPLDWKDWQMIGACIIFFGLLGILEHLGRESGYKLQPELFRRWDGAPTTRFLRHRDLTLNAITKQRYHNSLTA